METLGQRLRIGTYTLLTETERVNHYETAAWFKKIRVSPGDYPIWGTLAHTDSPRGWDTVDSAGTDDMPGIVTDAFFPSLFGGVMVGANPGAEMIGKHGVAFGIRWRGYELAHAIAEAVTANDPSLALVDKLSHRSSTAVKRGPLITLADRFDLKRTAYVTDEGNAAMRYSIVSDTAALFCPGCAQTVEGRKPEWTYITHAGEFISVASLSMTHYPLQCRRCHQMNEEAVEAEHQMAVWRSQRIAAAKRSDAQRKEWLDEFLAREQARRDAQSHTP